MLQHFVFKAFDFIATEVLFWIKEFIELNNEEA